VEDENDDRMTVTRASQKRIEFLILTRLQEVEPVTTNASGNVSPTVPP
jgi:hypothetical protein